MLIAALFFLIPLDYVLPHFGSATVVTMASICIIFYGIIYVVVHKNGKLVFINGSLSLAFVVFVFMISIIWAINRDVVFSRILTVANSVLLYFSIIQFEYDKESIKLIENASLIGAAVLVLYVITKVDLSLVYAGYRLRFSQLGSIYFSDPNGLAGRILFPLIISINRVLFGSKKTLRLFYVILIIAFSYIILLTGSRAGVVAIAAAAILFSIQGFEKKKRGLMISIIVLLLIAYYFAPKYLPEHITNRLFSVEKYREVSNLEGDRIDIWGHVIIDLFISSPLVGYGGGCSSYALAQFYGHTKAVHNSYLLVLCEVGLLGFVPWIYFIICQIKEARFLRKFSTVVFPVTIAVLLLAMTLDAFTEKYLWQIFIYIYIIWFCSNRNDDLYSYM